jgi:hypothetical protein
MKLHEITRTSLSQQRNYERNVTKSPQQWVQGIR